MSERQESNLDTEKLAKLYASSLFNWVMNNGLSGWDKYDVPGTKLFLWARSKRTFFRRGINFLGDRLERKFPYFLRTLFGCKKKINAKALGLIAESTLIAQKYNLPSTGSFLALEIECRKQLDLCKQSNYGGIGWGYPFDWKSRILIPKNTPTVVNSAIIGDYYWTKYKVDNSQENLIICKEIAEFIATGLNQSKDAVGDICFSYTPLDNFEVHNANLFGAEFIARVGKEIDNDEWLALALKSANFSLNDALEDGTLPYWSSRQTIGKIQQDTYHAGFEIRALHRLGKSLNDQKLKNGAIKYFNVWQKDYFNPNGTPKFIRDGGKNIIEVHSLAEAMLTYGYMYNESVITREDYVEQISKLLEYSCKMLWVNTSDDVGYFVEDYNVDTGSRSKIAYLRWSQAWMLRGLTSVLEMLNKSN